MAEFGIQLLNGAVMSQVDSGYSNYSIARTFTRSFTGRGIKTVNLDENGSELLVAVRHPGAEVAFIRYIPGSPSKVEIYVHDSATIDFQIYKPDQRVGETGWGMRITDPAGNEVYHTDLSYLAVNDFNQFETSLNGGYYILGSYRDFRYEFEEDTAGGSSSIPIWEWVDVRVCSYQQVPGTGTSVTTCGFTASPLQGGTYECTTEFIPPEFEYVCELERQFIRTGTQTSWWAQYWVDMKKFVTTVLHKGDDRIEKRERLFWEGRVFEDAVGGSDVSRLSDYQIENGWSVFPTLSGTVNAGLYAQYLDGLYNPENVSSSPNKLLTSDAGFA